MMKQGRVSDLPMWGKSREAFMKLRSDVLIPLREELVKTRNGLMEERAKLERLQSRDTLPPPMAGSARMDEKP